MAVVEGLGACLSLDAKGKVGRPNFLGTSIFGMTWFGDTMVWSGIYQHRHKKGRKILARIKHYWPTNTQQVNQQAWRQVFADGMASWGALTPEEKMIYNQEGVVLRLPGYSVYLRKYLSEHRL